MDGSSGPKARNRLRNALSALGPINMSIEAPTVAGLGDNAAVATFRYRWRTGSDQSQVIVGAMTVVYERVGSEWKVLHDHTSTLSPEAMPAALAGGITGGGPPAPVRATRPCVVARIVDGDTIECQGVGRVRLIGMDTPEASQVPYGDMATEALAFILGDASEIVLEGDVEARDRYGRTVASGPYIYRLVAKGFAKARVMVLVR